ncbi:Mrr restriction system protein [Lysobacter dokdonensis DS-58]|uniref:Mrr restriction system protein n=2 Tax=Noviluteimonas TaxID=3382693 RepID=A0A0A2WPU5_9GAMM|nr:Mrr restriction system protein [Lysobacter dokdonensis DS-58]
MAFSALAPNPLPDAEVQRIAFEALDVRLRPVDEDRAPAPVVLSAQIQTVQSPDDRLDQALSEIKQSVAGDLLDQLMSVTPQFFEEVVLDVLHAVGYGANRSDLQRVGGPGDSGIDGIISLDRLGLERVYVQAKRWKDCVGRPEIQAFFGALAGQRATKGVFITTSSFSQQAVQYAASVGHVVLVDGVKLAELMIDHEVGISVRAVHIPKVDSDYFEEGT